MFRSVQAFLRKRIPPGETLAVDGRWDLAFKSRMMWEMEWGMGLVALYDCYVVAPARGSDGVEDLHQRRKDLHRMLGPDTPWPERRNLLGKYDITYFFLTNRRDLDLEHGSFDQSWESGPYMIVRLRTDH